MGNFGKNSRKIRFFCSSALPVLLVFVFLPRYGLKAIRPNGLRTLRRTFLFYRAVAPNGAMVGTVPTANRYEPSSFDRASHLGVSGSMFVNLKKMAKQTYIYLAE